MDPSARLFAQTDAFTGYTFDFAGQVNLPILRRAFEVLVSNYPILRARLRTGHPRLELCHGDHEPQFLPVPYAPAATAHVGLDGTASLQRLFVRRGDLGTLVTLLVHATVADFEGAAALTVELWGLYNVLLGMRGERQRAEERGGTRRHPASIDGGRPTRRRRTRCTFTQDRLTRSATTRLRNLAAREGVSLASLVSAAALHTELGMRQGSVRELPLLLSIPRPLGLTAPAGAGVEAGIRLASFRAPRQLPPLIALARAIEAERAQGRFQRHGVSTVTLAATSAAAKQSEITTCVVGGQFPFDSWHPDLAIRGIYPEFSYTVSPDASGLCLSAALRNFYVAAIIEGELTIHRREMNSDSATDVSYATDIAARLRKSVADAPAEHEPHSPTAGA
ncbi:hypothetical protein [Nocardia brasiliensis]|uniref:hypothetical protein n=1 Tax=Nocardia brasiliensis TaxID=37326 RepID=UPI0024571135|nr:hypothetical protein [Nocardia brasiliensis]